MNRPIAIPCSMMHGPVCRSMTQNGKDEFQARDHRPTRPHLAPLCVKRASFVNGHEEIRVGGQVISWLAVTGNRGGWPADLPGSGQGKATTPFPARAWARRWESP